MSISFDERISNHFGTEPLAIRTPRILCVDDDPDFQTTIELRMRAYEVEIERAFYGMQGIVEAVQTQPDLVLMDLAMPNGDGEYLLECIKRNKATANIPVIVLTGMRDPSLKRRLLQAGAAVFLNKPVHFDELLHHISRFVDVRQRDSDGE
jgi:two-component system response regulator MprA